jgi:MoxR-like ATPase
VVVGKRRPLSLVLAGVLAGGHVLLEDFPGLGKTLAARSLAQTLGLDFRRLQFTPDLLPSDVTGSFVYDQRAGDFAFRAGPLFCGLLLADEINRTPPKTQSALLEAMQERQVTVEGRTFRLPAPFHVVATANPIEYEGTYPLPEAQLDRFLLRVGFGYPRRDEELDVLRRRVARRREETVLDPVLDAEGLLGVQRTVEEVTVEDTVAGYCVDLAAATRIRQQVLVGASPRGALALMLVARAHAVLRRRDYVTPEDVKAVAVAVLGHRLTLKPELWMRRVAPEDVVREVLAEVPAPPTVRPGGPGSSVPGPGPDRPGRAGSGPAGPDRAGPGQWPAAPSGHPARYADPGWSSPPGPPGPTKSSGPADPAHPTGAGGGSAGPEGPAGPGGPDGPDRR